MARLDLGPKGGRVLVLAGASGRTLAFGPGHLGSTPLPGAGGNSAIAGHRDTHFAALADLALGDRLWFEIPGRTLGYRVTETRVVDRVEVGVLADRGHEGLTLITCYPFDTDPGRAPEVRGLCRVPIGRASARRGVAREAMPLGRAIARPRSSPERFATFG